MPNTLRGALFSCNDIVATGRDSPLIIGGLERPRKLALGSIWVNPTMKRHAVLIVVLSDTIGVLG